MRKRGIVGKNAKDRHDASVPFLIVTSNKPCTSRQLKYQYQSLPFLFLFYFLFFKNQDDPTTAYFPSQIFSTVWAIKVAIKLEAVLSLSILMSFLLLSFCVGFLHHGFFFRKCFSVFSSPCLFTLGHMSSMQINLENWFSYLNFGMQMLINVFVRIFSWSALCHGPNPLCPEERPKRRSKVLEHGREISTSLEIEYYMI